MPERYPVSVESRAPTGETNAYIVGDAERLLVDPAGHTPDLDAAVESDVGGEGCAVQAPPVEHVAVTHTHPDHVGAVAAYAAETDATVWAHTAFTDRFERATGVTPDRTFRPGDAIGDTGITVMDTPGHAPDHVAFVVDAGDGGGTHAVTGDLAFASGSVFIGADEGDMRAYLASLRRALARDFDRLHPGHGPVVENPGERLRWLYGHRRDRERSVRRAVESGAATVPEILDAAYEKDLDGVRDLAAETVRAHLEKLRVEGKVEWDGSRVTPRD
ncbi:MBL fold metallo-hydrolase [Halobacterium zhouii]|uniref:MBL fold metallo-hydrolase n=1 Tax=Halobacterium zhouii TaxID=2902624 RepID=UPI0032C46B85